MGIYFVRFIVTAGARGYHFAVAPAQTLLSPYTHGAMMVVVPYAHVRVRKPECLNVYRQIFFCDTMPAVIIMYMIYCLPVVIKNRSRTFRTDL